METETALLWGFIVLLLLVVATVTALLVHSGLLIPVDVKTCKPDIGEIQIAYKFAQGPYKDSGMLFTEVHSLLPQYRTIGVYYDDPNTKQPHKLRYIVGIILSENGSPTNAEHLKLLEENNYRFATFPSIDHAVQTKFPFKSTISIIVAIMKVYPSLREYIEHRSLCARPFLEVYDNEKSEILFVGPLARQDDFYVPEVLQEEEDNREDDDFEDDRTENSSRSWDESASFIREPETPGGNQPVPPPSEAAAASTSAVVPPAPANEGVDGADTASAGGDESDANTGSSFEEIDEREAAVMPEAGTMDENLSASVKKDDDEGER
ncbi:testis-expressed protein 264 homolog isoform X2 [Penaeus chinensis]|uniref:testis-expressed protein 264 homolog isoform X2 n=1 Tax=Penaeus chinensis TaxID=139456 RepID=UPI001FB69265|nr:testis-expressed protein 264 homolog isoform X2 [Penaeus chinensis]